MSAEKEKWKTEAARVAAANCLAFHDLVDTLDGVVPLKSPVPLPEGAAQGSLLLKTLFRKGEKACVAVSVSSVKILDAHHFKITKRDLPEGAWFRVNRVIADTPSGRKGGVTDADSATDFLMIEMDRASRPAQLSFWAAVISAGFPVISLTDSGGKSFHAIIRINAGSIDDFKSTADRILNLLEPFLPDGTSRNNSRLTRLPGVLRGTGEEQREQELVYLNPKAPVWSWNDEVVGLLEAFKPQAQPLPDAVRSALTKAAARRERPQEGDESADKDFRKRLEAVLHNRTIDMLAFAEKADWHLFSSGVVAGLEDKHFIRCPFSNEHTGGGSDDSETDAYLFQRTTSARFKWGFHCSHNSCAGRRIIDVLEVAAEEEPDSFKDALEPDRDFTADFDSIPEVVLPDDAPVPVVPESLLLGVPNDVDNTEIFVSLFKDTVRFLHDEGRWLFWDGTRWVRDMSGKIKRLASEVCSMRRRAAGDDVEADNRAKHSGSAQAIKNMLDLASSTLPIATNSTCFDTNPMWLGVKNGVIDLTTGTLMPPKPSQHVSKQCSVGFYPDAGCPVWIKTGHSVFEGIPEVFGLLQRWFGYGLTGNVSEQKMMIFYGTGRNGKSTILEAIAAIMGDYCIASPQSLLIASKNEDPKAASPEKAELKGMRLSFVSETDSAAPLAAGKMKSITGGDTISCRVNRGDYFTFKPQVKLILSTNHKPSIRDGDEGVWRRINLVPFRQSFKGREDFSLNDVLRTESEGILAWMVRGCLAWQESRLAVPEVVVRETDEYRGNEDLVGTFMAECAIITTSYLDRVTFKEMYAAYRTWARDNGLYPSSAIAFNRRMKDRGFKFIRSSGVDHWEYCSLKLLALDE